MKKQTEINFSKIITEQNITSTTVESKFIAIGYVPCKTFTAIDLWNIRRRSKSMSNRRHLA